jgi:hypothetical protein
MHTFIMLDESRVTLSFTHISIYTHTHIGMHNDTHISMHNDTHVSMRNHAHVGVHMLLARTLDTPSVSACLAGLCPSVMLRTLLCRNVYAFEAVED